MSAFMNSIFTRPGSDAGFELFPNWYEKGGLKGWRAAQAGQIEVPRLRKPDDDEQIRSVMGNWDPELSALISQTGLSKDGHPSFLFADASQMIANGYYRPDDTFVLQSITMECGGKGSGRGALLAAEAAGWDLDKIQFSGSPKGIIAARAAVQKEHERRQKVLLDSMTLWSDAQLGNILDIQKREQDIVALNARNTPADDAEAYERQKTVDQMKGSVGLSGGKPSYEADHKVNLVSAIQAKLSHGQVPLSVVTEILHENINNLKTNAKEPDFKKIAIQLGINLPWQTQRPQPGYGPQGPWTAGPGRAGAGANP